MSLPDGQGTSIPCALNRLTAALRGADTGVMSAVPTTPARVAVDAVALAYPVFVLTVAVVVRAVAEPSRRLAFAVPLACILAVATRVQFLVLPLAYLAAVALCARGSYRRHAVPVAVTSLFVVVLVAV